MGILLPFKRDYGIKMVGPQSQQDYYDKMIPTRTVFLTHKKKRKVTLKIRIIKTAGKCLDENCLHLF